MTAPVPETDPRFPSGRWTGFFLQRLLPGRHAMELLLDFAAGSLRGEGRDRVGEFVIEGSYDLNSGKCWFRKQYLQAHTVVYQGYNEGKGIWGVWELVEPQLTQRGGFHIWPEGMSDPTGSTLHEAKELPVERKKKRKRVPVGAP